MESLVGSISKCIDSILENRNQAKEEYIKAWLSVNIPYQTSNQMDWIINNVELVEEKKQKSITWYLRLKS